MFVYFDLSIFCFHFKKYPFGNHNLTQKKKGKKKEKGNSKHSAYQDMFTHWVEHFQKRLKTDVEKNLPARITEGSADYICIFLVVKIKFFVP